MSLEETLRNLSFEPITKYDLNDSTKVHIMDFSIDNPDLDFLKGNKDPLALTNFVNQQLSIHNCTIGIGGYGEDRVIYKFSDVFNKANDEPRSIHLGIDIWAEAGTKIYCPLDGEIYSLKDNDSIGDYGPTIIVKHTIKEMSFYTLYGHLSKASLVGKNEGDLIKAGDQLATLGVFHENVNWPPHLHFQIIKHIAEKTGDYPGVAKPSEKDYYLDNCPNPNLILGVKALP